MVSFEEMRGTDKDARVAWYYFIEMRGTGKDARVVWYHSMRWEALTKMPGWHGIIR